ncbi:hypothetical protein JCM8202v2_005462 [Rhodotorula sphaerocarpa]
MVDVLTGALAGLSLIAMSVYDIEHDPKAHVAFATSFIVFLDLSGLLQTIEVSHLWHEHPDRRSLEAGAFLKWTILAIASACGITFLILHAQCGEADFEQTWATCYRTSTAGAILQWIAAFGWGTYLATLIIDLWPIHRHSIRVLPCMQADSTGQIHRIWLPDTVDGPNWISVPPGCSVQRFPPVLGPAAHCGVIILRQRTTALLRGTMAGSREQQEEWYEPGKSRERRSRRR